MKKYEDGFLTIDTIVGLAVVTIISILLISFLKNNIHISARNKNKLYLLNSTDNFLKEIINEKSEKSFIKNIRSEIIENNFLDIDIKENINIKIKAEKIGDNLLKLFIKSNLKNSNIEDLKLVIVIEEI